MVIVDWSPVSVKGNDIFTHLLLHGDSRLVSRSLSKETDCALVDADGVCNNPTIPLSLKLPAELGVMSSNLATSRLPDTATEYSKNQK